MDKREFNELLRKYSRYILFVFNLFFVITGIIILSVGLSVKGYFHEYGTILENKYFYASDLLIVIGVIIFLISFLGCCGALKENACMTLTFSSLLIVILLLELFAGISGIILKNKAEEVVDERLNSTMKMYNGTNNQSAEITFLWDKIQSNFNCCGVHNYTDWKNLNKSFPMTCCTIPSGTINVFTCNDTEKYYFHKKGCLSKLTDYVEDHSVSVGLVGLGLGVVQLLGIILSCYLAKQIKSDYETV